MYAEKGLSVHVQSLCRELERDAGVKTLFCPSAENGGNVYWSYSAAENSFRSMSPGSVVVVSENDGKSLLLCSRKRRSFLNEAKAACVSAIVFTAGYAPGQEIIAFCRNHHIALLVSSYDSHYLESRLTRIWREKILKTTVCHGAFLQLYGLGVLITGDAGVGKTTCALTLARSGHVWIADDLVEITAQDATLLARAYGSTKNLAALRSHDGITIETLSSMAYTQDEGPVDLWCELQKDMEGQMEVRKRSILGVSLPFCCFPSLAEMPDIPLAIEDWVRSFAFERKKHEP